MQPGVSVIIPCYNATATLARTLRSLHHIPADAQPHTQVILVDDGSQDDTWAELQKHQTQLTADGFRVLLLRQQNKGPAAARNHALAHADGRWIYFLDADDELAFDPYRYINADERAAEVSCFGFAQRFVKHGADAHLRRPRRVGPDNYLNLMTAGNPYQPSALLFRRDAIDEPFPEAIHFAEDWVFWATNPRIFSHMVIVPTQIASRVHIHGANTSSQYARAGLYRVKAAETLLDHYRGRLTRKQTHNLRLQVACGLLQQGRFPRLSAFVPFPCSTILYAKFWAYLLAKLTGRRATPY